MSKIKLYFLTGFLGSGKTTILRNLLENMEGTKVGVIQNELGKISIDGTVLQNNDIQMVELNRGSIFCSCLRLSFVDALVQKRSGIRVCRELRVWRSVQCGRNSCGDGSDGSGCI